MLWVLLNLAGMTLYLWLASALWVSAGDEGTPGGPGDAFYFFLFLVPLLFAFAVANAVFLLFIFRQIGLWKGIVVFAIWYALATLWLVTEAFDHKKSFRIVYPQCGCSNCVLYVFMEITVQLFPRSLVTYGLSGIFW